VRHDIVAVFKNMKSPSRENSSSGVTPSNEDVKSLLGYAFRLFLWLIKHWRVKDSVVHPVVFKKFLLLGRYLLITLDCLLCLSKEVLRTQSVSFR